MSRKTHNETLERVGAPNLARLVRNIESYWTRATPADVASGAEWYANGRQTVADISAATGHAPDTVAAVVAQLSPRTTWARNISAAWAVCAANGDDETLFQAGRSVGALGANVRRAIVAINSSDPLGTINGPKTRAFAANLSGSDDDVTVDVWAARIALTPNWTRASGNDAETVLGRAGVYDAVAYAYRIAAAKAGVSPAIMQATTWIVARNGRAS